MKSLKINTYFKILMAVIIVFAVLGGIPGVPRFFHKMRHAFYLDVFLLGLFFLNVNFRKAFSRFLKNPVESLNVEMAHHWIKFFIIFYFIVFVKVSLLNYFSFSVRAMDFSTYDWLIPSLFHRGSFYSSACDCNHMGYHGTYILFFTAPFHILLNHPLFSILAHPIIAWSAVFPLRKLAAQFKLPHIYQVLIVFLYFNFFSVAHIVKNNLHIEVYYLPIIFWFLFFIESQKPLLLIISTLLFLIVKEDSGLYVFSTMIAAYLFKERNKLYLILSLVGLIYFFLVLKYFIPSFREDGAYHFVDAVSKYGQTIPDTVKGILAHPFEVTKDIFTGGWIRYLFYFLLLPILDPFFIIATAPFVVVHSIAASPLMRSLVLYYSAPFVPFLFYSYLHFLSKREIRKVVLTHKMKSLSLCLILAASLLIGSGYFTFRKPMYNYSQFRSDISKIPKNKLVCAHDSIFPHMPYETDLLRLSPICTIDKVDVFIIHKDLDLNDMSQDFFNSKILEIEISQKFDKYQNSDGFVFYTKK